MMFCAPPVPAPGKFWCTWPWTPCTRFRRYSVLPVLASTSVRYVCAASTCTVVSHTTRFVARRRARRARPGRRSRTASICRALRPVARDRRRRRGAGGRVGSDTRLTGGEARRHRHRGDAGHRRAREVDEAAVRREVGAQAAAQRRDAAGALLPEKAQKAVAGAHPPHQHEIVDVGVGEAERGPVGADVPDRDRGRIGRRWRGEEPVQTPDLAETAGRRVHGHQGVSAEARAQARDRSRILRRDDDDGPRVVVVVGAPDGRRMGDRSRRGREHGQGEQRGEGTAHRSTIPWRSGAPIPSSGGRGATATARHTCSV